MSMIVETNMRGLARLLYWISMLLLVIGGRTLIDPSNRAAGVTEHIYITIVAFELYIWLLLALARWQARKQLVSDVARSGIFALALQGLIFMVLSELHMADLQQGVWVAGVCLVLAVVKLLLACRWLGIVMPRPMLAMCLLWFVSMVVPGIVLRVLREQTDWQRVVGLASCWAVALLVACHIPLAAWQRRRGFGAAVLQLERWSVPWIVSLILGAMSAIQLYAGRYGMWVDWPMWYFSPIVLAAGVASVCLATVVGRRAELAWVALAVSAMLALVFSVDDTFAGLPASLQNPAAQCITHPVYAPGVFLSLLLLWTAYVTTRRWLAIVALVGPVGGGLVKGTQAIYESGIVQRYIDAVCAYKYGPGVAMLVGAFVLLGAGAALQWWREKIKASLPPPVPTMPATPTTAQADSIAVEPVAVEPPAATDSRDAGPRNKW